MELKEYVKIIKENSGLFLVVIAIIVIGAFAYFFLKPVSFTASLALNITRSGVQQTEEYRYDDFYRLQADEKFSETVVQWLKNPRTAADIYEEAGINPETFSLRQLSKSFDAEKLSSQIVAVSFSVAEEKTARKISSAISEAVSKNTEMLNKNQKENTWFAVLAQDPVIVKNTANPVIVLFLSLLVGIFLGFWAVMIRHYLK